MRPCASRRSDVTRDPTSGSSRTVAFATERARGPVVLVQPGAAIELRCEREVHGTWDPHRVAQAVSNLLGNAVQHGGGGAIVVDVRGDEREAVVEIHNEGEIPAERADGLFKPFTARPEGSTRGGGLGLGLFISRAIARAHGGDVALSSTHGAGTTARLRMPLSGRPPDLS